MKAEKTLPALGMAEAPCVQGCLSLLPRDQTWGILSRSSSGARWSGLHHSEADPDVGAESGSSVAQRSLCWHIQPIPPAETLNGVEVLAAEIF